MRELIGRYVFSSEIKKSRFIAHAMPATCPETALLSIETVRDTTATHNCWAYRIESQYRFSDDGEPAGTAGRPILAAIEKQEIDHCLVVVTRFFGGIKLGAGGLVRAYGGTAAECLRNAPTRELRIFLDLRIEAPFDAIGSVYNLLKKYCAQKKAEQFESDGVRLSIRLEAAERGPFEIELAEVTRGQATLHDEE
jgi:uncharacterized YigZ family protein